MDKYLVNEFKKEYKKSFKVLRETDYSFTCEEFTLEKDKTPKVFTVMLSYFFNK